MRRALVVPLAVGDEVIGALAVFDERPRPYREGEEGLLVALSSQLAVAVQNARLHERTKQLGTVLERTLASERRTARQLRGLWQITNEFARTLSLEIVWCAMRARPRLCTASSSSLLRRLYMHAKCGTRRLNARPHNSSVVK